MSTNDGHAQSTSVQEANAPGGVNPTLQGDPSSVETSQCLKLVSGLEQDSQVSCHPDIRKKLTLTDHSGQSREFTSDVLYTTANWKQLKLFLTF